MRIIRGEVVSASILFVALPVVAQLNTTPPSQGGAGTRNGASVDGGQVGAPTGRRTTGAVTGGHLIQGAAVVTPGVTQLSLEDSIQIAIRNNLSTLLAREGRREAEGFKQQARSSLLPNISWFGLSGERHAKSCGAWLPTRHLSRHHSIPSLAHSIISTRARLVQTIFNLSSFKNYQAGRAGVRVAEYEEQLGARAGRQRDGARLFRSLRSGRAVTAAQANVELAQALAKPR